jgi:hypothetical protein
MVKRQTGRGNSVASMYLSFKFAVLAFDAVARIVCSAQIGTRY